MGSGFPKARFWNADGTVFAVLGAMATDAVANTPTVIERAISRLLICISLLAGNTGTNKFDTILSQL